MSKPSFISALKWSTASELLSKAVQPVVFIILARILTPEEFGVMSVALIVISFTQVFWDAGMSKAIIQIQSRASEAVNAAFWINISTGIFFSVFLYFSSAYIANQLFHDNRVTDVLKLMTLQIVLGSLGSVQIAILQKEMKFNRLFWVRLATVSIPGILSIPLAMSGMSYWAIVAGSLTGQAMQVAVLWTMCQWRPTFSFNVAVAKDLVRFGFWVSLTGLLVWFYLWADSFVVGAFLGTHDLGLFRTGNTFVLLLFDVLFAPILPVLYSYFANLSDQTRIYQAASRIVRIIAIIAIPLAMLLFTLSGPISDVFFGEKWVGIAFIIGHLGLMRGFGWLVGINGEVYRALNKPQHETMVYAFSSVFFLTGYLISIQVGFREFIYTRLILGMLSLLPHFYLFKKVLKNPLKPIIRTAIISTFAGCIPIIVNLLMPDFSPIVHIILVSLVAVPLAGLLIFFMERQFVWSFVMELTKRPLSKEHISNGAI